MWPVVALAAVNVMVTPLTSGEWFYQRTEDGSYQEAVAKGDFTAFDRLIADHDPHLLPRMIAIAVSLLVPLVGLAVLQGHGRRGERAAAATRTVITVAVLAAALATVIQAWLLIF